MLSVITITSSIKPIITAEKIIDSESGCTCSGAVLTAALSSTVIISLVISIILFITGFLCGQYFSIKFRSSKRAHTTIDHVRQAPEYEDIDAQPIARATKHQEQVLELKENVAYCPSKPIVEQ